MRKLLMVLVIAVSACVPVYSTVPQPTSVASPFAPGDAYTSAMRELVSKGYRVLAADRAAGFIRAEREVPCTFSWCHKYDMQDVSVVAREAGGSLVQLTPSTEILPADKKRRPDGVSKTARADAEQVLAVFKTQAR